MKKVILENGLVGDWKAAVEMIQNVIEECGGWSWEEYYFVYSDNEFESYFIESKEILDKFVETEFWEAEQFRYLESETYLEYLHIWKFVSARDVKRYPSTNAKAKPTRFKDKDGEIIYRRPVEIWAENTIQIGTND